VVIMVTAGIVGLLCVSLTVTVTVEASFYLHNCNGGDNFAVENCTFRGTVAVTVRRKGRVGLGARKHAQWESNAQVQREVHDTALPGPSPFSSDALPYPAGTVQTADPALLWPARGRPIFFAILPGELAFVYLQLARTPPSRVRSRSLLASRSRPRFALSSRARGAHRPIHPPSHIQQARDRLLLRAQDMNLN
jgi:hypothetical protein